MNPIMSQNSYMFEVRIYALMFNRNYIILQFNAAFIV